MNAFLRGERYVSSNAVRSLLRRVASMLQHLSYCQRCLAFFQRSTFLSEGVFHAGMLGVQSRSVGQMNEYPDTRVYCLVVRTSPRWSLWPPLWGLFIDAAFAVRIQWVYWIEP